MMKQRRRNRFCPNPIRRFISIIPAACFCAYAGVQSPLDIRTFPTATATWLVGPGGVMTYGNESRSVKNIPLNIEGQEDSIADAVESDGVLWLSTAAGICMLDMTTATVEKIPFAGQAYRAGKIAADADYVWLASSGILWKLDKLSREWLSITCALDGRAPSSALGLYSDESNVFWIDNSGVFIFSVAEEKWDHVGLQAPALSDETVFRTVKGGAVLIDKTRLVHYVSAGRSWESVEADGVIVDAVLEDTVVYYATEKTVVSYKTPTAIRAPLNITGVTSIQGIAKKQDTLYIAQPNGFTTYSVSAKTSGFIQHSPRISEPSVSKVFFSGPLLVAHYPADIGSYDGRVGAVVNRAPRQTVRADFPHTAFP